MAASATSVPEAAGGARNWDYRYTWIRDSAVMLRSLYRLAFGWEAIDYFGFIIDALSGGDLGRHPARGRQGRALRLAGILAAAWG